MEGSAEKKIDVNRPRRPPFEPNSSIFGRLSVNLLYKTSIAINEDKKID